MFEYLISLSLQSYHMYTQPFMAASFFSIMARFQAGTPIQRASLAASSARRMASSASSLACFFSTTFCCQACSGCCTKKTSDTNRHDQDWFQQTRWTNYYAPRRAMDIAVNSPLLPPLPLLPQVAAAGLESAAVFALLLTAAVVSARY